MQDGRSCSWLIALPWRSKAACFAQTALDLVLPALALVLQLLAFVRVVLAFVGRQPPTSAMRVRAPEHGVPGGAAQWLLTLST